MEDVLTTKPTTFWKLKGRCIVTFHFWCKENYIEEAKQFVDLLGSL